MCVTITPRPHGRVPGRQMRQAAQIRASFLPNIQAVRFPVNRRDKVVRLAVRVCLARACTAGCRPRHIDERLISLGSTIFTDDGVGNSTNLLAFP